MDHDATLLDAARSGDAAALARLLEQHASSVRRAIAIPDRWQSVLSADDVLQQTYVDAIRDIDRLDATEPDAVPRWLTTIARRNLVDAIRMLESKKRGGDRRRVESRRRDDSCVGLYEQLAMTSTTPSRIVARREAISSLERALQALPDDYRGVVERYDLEGQPIEAVADALDRSPGAVYMIRARALRMLAERLQAA